jgi:hypothetical protein
MCLWVLTEAIRGAVMRSLGLPLEKLEQIEKDHVGIERVGHQHLSSTSLSSTRLHLLVSVRKD